MRKQILMGMIAASACVVASGCAEKKDGPQTIIIELADPTDVEESSAAEIEQTIETESENESESQNEEITEAAEKYPQIGGLSDNITLSYTQIGTDDPIIGMVIADIVPEVHAKDLNIINIQAYMDNEEVVPYGELTFNLNVDPESQVVLYKLDSDGKIISEQMEVFDGMVSYQTSGCGRWLVINTDLLPEISESESESEAMSE